MLCVGLLAASVLTTGEASAAALRETNCHTKTFLPLAITGDITVCSEVSGNGSEFGGGFINSTTSFPAGTWKFTVDLIVNDAPGNEQIPMHLERSYDSLPNNDTLRTAVQDILYKDYDFNRVCATLHYGGSKLFPPYDLSPFDVQNCTLRNK
jgi:hypothetical protein